MELNPTLVAQICLTLVTAGYGIGPLIADLNATHATNPLWTPHARFHVIWQISSFSLFAAMAMALIWYPGAYQTERLYFAAAFAGCVILGFIIAYLTMGLYGGLNYDTNGYLPVPVKLLGLKFKLDANLTVFSVLIALLSVAVWANSHAGQMITLSAR